MKNAFSYYMGQDHEVHPYITQCMKRQQIAITYGILPHEVEEKLTTYDMACYRISKSHEAEINALQEKAAKKK